MQSTSTYSTDSTCTYILGSYSHVSILLISLTTQVLTSSTTQVPTCSITKDYTCSTSQVSTQSISPTTQVPTCSVCIYQVPTLSTSPTSTCSTNQVPTRTTNQVPTCPKFQVPTCHTSINPILSRYTNHSKTPEPPTQAGIQLRQSMGSRDRTIPISWDRTIPSTPAGYEGRQSRRSYSHPTNQNNLIYYSTNCYFCYSTSYYHISYSTIGTFTNTYVSYTTLGTY